MGLSSRLFNGDKRLEAAQVDDRAHLTVGAQGHHVAKVQMALNAVDWLRIDRIELARQYYGRSTAAAVLAYKTRRSIINHAYQNTPDDIVGKMTITRLDSDLRLWEASQQHRGDCRCGVRTALDPAALAQRRGGTARLGFALAVPAADPVAAGRPAALPQFRRTLRIHLSITRRAALEDGFPLAASVEAARDRLFAYGMSLSPEFGAVNGHRFVDTIDFPEPAVTNDHVALLRQAAASSHPGAPKVLRIIVCQRSVNQGPGETFRGISVGGVSFPPFCLLNSRTVSRDHSTMLHEMIHAAYDPPEYHHDPEKYSIFYEYAPTQPESPDRVWLKPDRAQALSKGFYAI